MSRKLDDLDPAFRPLAVEFLARLTEARIPVVITCTLRTAEEQQEAVSKGVSWTMHSRHLSGKAIDVCPYKTYVLHGMNSLQWDERDPVWTRIGAIGQACGLKWGVVKDGKQVDPGHFEMMEGR